MSEEIEITVGKHEVRIARNEEDIKGIYSKQWQMLILTVVNILAAAIIFIKGIKI